MEALHERHEPHAIGGDHPQRLQFQSPHQGLRQGPFRIQTCPFMRGLCDGGETDAKTYIETTANVIG